MMRVILLSWASLGAFFGFRSFCRLCPSIPSSKALFFRKRLYYGHPVAAIDNGLIGRTVCAGLRIGAIFEGHRHQTPMEAPVERNSSEPPALEELSPQDASYYQIYVYIAQGTSAICMPKWIMRLPDSSSGIALVAMFEVLKGAAYDSYVAVLTYSIRYSCGYRSWKQAEPGL